MSASSGLFVRSSVSTMPAIHSSMSLVAPSIASTSTPSNPLSRDQLVVVLQIPIHLTVRTEHDHNLLFSYQKYLGYLQAIVALNEMTTSGTWIGRKPSSTNIVECFISKSMWHAYY
jgi:hypothetical protein